LSKHTLLKQTHLKVDYLLL